MFDFSPLLLLVRGGNVNYFMIAISGASLCAKDAGAGNLMAYEDKPQVGFSSSEAVWISSNSASYQLNGQGYTYTYVAIG